MALERLDEGLWVAAAPLSLLGLRIGTRMTVVRLSSGDLVVHSPIRLAGTVRPEIEALGQVRHIVAPNLFHHLFAAEAQAAWPKALLHAPRALRRKRPDLRIDVELGETPRSDWGDELVPLSIQGCALHETVFLHPRTRTVVSSDLVESFETSEHLPTRLYLKLSGIHGKPGWSRLLRFLYKDRVAARRDIDRILEWDFDRLVVAHGNVLERDAKDAVRSTFSFLPNR